MKIYTKTTGIASTNTYILKKPNTSDCIIIDPGQETDKVTEFLKQRSLTPKAVINTHGHFDHIWGCQKIKKDFPQADIYIHQKDKNFFTDPSKNASIYLGLNMPQSAPDKIIKTKKFGQSEINIKNFKFKAIHTPGYSPGSICLYQPLVLFSGDLIFNRGVGRTDLSGSSHKDLLRSIKNILKLPSQTTVYPGHGPTTTIKKFSKFWSNNKLFQ